jgi:hypothetical protein
MAGAYWKNIRGGVFFVAVAGHQDPNGDPLQESGPRHENPDHAAAIRLRLTILGLDPGLVHDVEGRLGGSPKMAEAGRRDDVANAGLAGLRPQAQTHLLGS